ncbi:MAG TPA: lysophospholipid acyltransferase family protein [Gemmatimonadaceae bacterium]|jgi:1-acyl-sn-glycerol-3-phosphate acyltransferase|nr:lysophospholipid acyltransferase family protein [Gemmatimonadaceae bacterium]
MRSSAFLFAYIIYLVLAMGLGQRVLLWPAIWLFPRHRRRMVRAWLQFHARSTLGMARVIANVHVSVGGEIPPESCIVVMNHQSVLDIPIGLSIVPGPYPLIPTRDRYRWGIPGISPLGRLAGFPFLSQKRVLSRAELAALTGAAEQVARGEQSLLIFPEGHRSRDGGLGRFMRNGLRIVLSRAERPVYCVAVRGMVNARTFADGLANFADLDVRVKISTPIAPPALGSDDRTVDAFIESLRQRMLAMLTELDAGETSEGEKVVSANAHD